jgi:alkylated DNA nucleotide flippase Atl1
LPERDARKLSRREVYTNIVGNVLADMLSDRSLERFREICSDGLSRVEAERSEQEQAEVSTSPDVAEETKAETSSAGNAVEEPGLQSEESNG